MTLRASCTLGILGLAAALLVTGCAGGSTPRLTGIESPAPVASASAAPSIGTLGTGFWDPSNPPAPEGTFSPTPGSWDEVHPPSGYTVVLLTHGSDAPTLTVANAVRAWAKAEHVTLTTVSPATSDDFVDDALHAVARKPDLVIVAGNEMVDPVAAVSPSHLAQQFLVVGAEIAEPTSNVTAADWTGAGFRGEGLGMPSAYDASTFTSERAARALRAGVAAVLNGATGFVVHVD